MGDDLRALGKLRVRQVEIDDEPQWK